MKNIKIFLEIFFFSTLRKITVGGFVNQLIKNSGIISKLTSVKIFDHIKI